MTTDTEIAGYWGECADNKKDGLNTINAAIRLWRMAEMTPKCQCGYPALECESLDHTGHRQALDEALRCKSCNEIRRDFKCICQKCHDTKIAEARADERRKCADDFEFLNKQIGIAYKKGQADLALAINQIEMPLSWVKIEAVIKKASESAANGESPSGSHPTTTLNSAPENACITPGCKNEARIINERVGIYAAFCKECIETKPENACKKKVKP